MEGRRTRPQTGRTGMGPAVVGWSVGCALAVVLIVLLGLTTIYIGTMRRSDDDSLVPPWEAFLVLLILAPVGAAWVGWALTRWLRRKSRP